MRAIDRDVQHIVNLVVVEARSALGSGRVGFFRMAAQSFANDARAYLDFWLGSIACSPRSSQRPAIPKLLLFMSVEALLLHKEDHELLQAVLSTG